MGWLGKTRERMIAVLKMLKFYGFSFLSQLSRALLLFILKDKVSISESAPEVV